MLQSVSTVRSFKLIFIVSPLIVISFLSLTQRILFITKNRLCIAKGCVLKGCVPRKMHLKNTLKVYVLGLASAVIPKSSAYPKNQIRRVLESKPEQLFESRTKTGIGVPLVVTYHPRFHNLTNTIRKLIIYLYAKEQVKKVFTPTPFVSFRSDQVSLRSYLVRTKVYPLIREKGYSYCGKITKLIITFIVTVNVLFALFLVKYVAYNMLSQQLTDFV